MPPAVTASVTRDTPHGVETVTTVFWAFGGQPTVVTAFGLQSQPGTPSPGPRSQEIAA